MQIVSHVIGGLIGAALALVLLYFVVIPLLR
jgi:hypothetical protein